MAKRRRLETPTANDLQELEEGFARETTGGPLNISAPIAQVAREAASLSEPAAATDRVTKAQADAMQRARAEGRIIEMIPVDQILADDLIRDRVNMNPEDMQELRVSIQENGLRMPIEVYALEGQSRPWGLLSGYRRLSAMRDLAAQGGGKEFGFIAALVRTPVGMPEAFVAMVEENEIRSDLSPYERGRIAVEAVRAGAFGSVEDAVNTLFASGSKAKRSKVRSFAAIHEGLGGALSFPQALSERQGLRVASAVKGGHAQALAQALSRFEAGSGADEWALLEPLLKSIEAGPKDVSLGGRPKAKKAARKVLRKLALPGGVSLSLEAEGAGYAIKLKGKGLTDEMLEDVMTDLEIKLSET